MLWLRKDKRNRTTAIEPSIAESTPLDEYLYRIDRYKSLKNFLLHLRYEECLINTKYEYILQLEVESISNDEFIRLTKSFEKITSIYKDILRFFCSAARWSSTARIPQKLSLYTNQNISQTKEAIFYLNNRMELEEDQIAKNYMQIRVKEMKTVIAVFGFGSDQIPQLLGIRPNDKFASYYEIIYDAVKCTYCQLDTYQFGMDIWTDLMNHMGSSAMMDFYNKLLKETKYNFSRLEQLFDDLVKFYGETYLDPKRWKCEEVDGLYRYIT